MRLQGKRLLIVGGNNVLDEIVRFAKESSITLVSAGNIRNSKIHEISAEQYYVDVTNEDIMKQLIIEKDIDGVFSCSSESVIPHSIKYLKDLGMYCYATLEQWNMLMNKRNLKDLCKKYDIDVIPEYKINSDTMEVMEKPIYPIIVKPADNGGSFGITVCNESSMLNAAINHAYAHSKCHQILIEQYIIGKYYQLEIYLQNGKAYLAYTKERIFYKEQEGSPKQPFIDIYPSKEENRIRESLYPKFAQLLLDLGISDGMVQLQGLLDEEHIYVMDIAYRLSGGMDYRPVYHEKGINIVENYLEHSLNGNWTGNFEVLLQPYSHYYATLCPGLKNGLITKIEGIEEIKSLDYVYDYFQYYDEGDQMTCSGRFQQTFCRIFICCNSYEELMKNTRNVMALIRVIDDKGSDMLLHSINEEDCYTQ